MATNPNIKKLAKLTALKNEVPKELANYVLENLTRREQITYLRHLKTIINKRTVLITTSTPLSQNMKREIEKKFYGKDIIYEIDSIGDGIRIQINDTIIDLSMNSFINQTIDNIKESL
ncbi:MAG TPA: hypothetical protein VG965_02870 [Patescibacteria group bacterium]|nr:hypothetical protein [Patescibacteria group bacterium]